MDADEIIDRLGLAPHPEGGHYRETWRHDPSDGSRGAGTAIAFLLRAGERSHWHRVDADELWFFHLGDPLRLLVEHDEHLLGPDLAAGHHVQVRVPAGAWQSAEPTGAFTLVSCTVSPAFEFEGFELAPPDFTPP